MFESFTDEALDAIAEKMGLDLPSGLDRVFIIEEIIEAIEEDTQDRRDLGKASVHVEEKKFSGSEFDEFDACLGAGPCLERRYNETMIRAICRDPAWAFAYWDVSESELSAIGAQNGDAALFLRITGLGANNGKGHEYFDIPVSEDDYQWYINLPRPKSSYRIDLCVKRDDHCRILAHSTIVAVPSQSLDEVLGDKMVNELFRLSAPTSLDQETMTANPQRILDRREGK